MNQYSVENLRLKLESANKEVSAFKYALDQSSIVAVTDAKGIITYVNDKFCEISKYSQSELVGKTHKVINSNFHEKTFFNDLWSTIAFGKVWQGEIKNRAKDGTEYWVSTFIVPFLDDSGKPFQYMAIRTDITARKVAEEKLKVKRGLLEQTLIERTRLEASEKAAQEASRVKSQFLANMSHEIRTPLNGILGMTQVLMQSDLSDIQLDCVKTILDSAEHLSLVVNDILDLAKIEANKMQLEISEFNLEEMVNGVDRALRHMAKAKGITFKVNYEKNLGPIFFGDFLRIRQILLNLVQNAIKFTDIGYVELSVDSEVLDLDRKNIIFRVEDSGIGMAEKTLHEIFNPFIQADSSTTRRFGGTGLGLSICKKLSQLMEGGLNVESKIGFGTTFILNVPLRSSVQRQTVVSNLKSQLTLDERKRLSILVAEDHPTNQKVIKKILENFGCQFKVVSDGQEAITESNQQDYDLILMDCHMPNCDGFSAASQIRKKNKTTPILALTADVMKGTREKCLKAGMNGHLSKPIDPTLLYKEIELFTQKKLISTESIYKKTSLELQKITKTK